MDQRLLEVLQGKEDSYILPFYWQHGTHPERIPHIMQKISECGIRAVCIESRPHPDFCGVSWWEDMDCILEEASKRDMQVWVLDDDHFPTGHANGQIEKRYPELRAWHLVETHLDFMGPAPESMSLVRKMDPEDELLSAYAYRRTGRGEELEPDFLPLSHCIRGNKLIWNVPEGCWRVFFLFRSRKTVDGYIDMLRPPSVRILLDAVYEPHYERYRRYFGNTFAGFFSDEPRFGNSLFYDTMERRGFYDHRMGMVGLAMPWREDIPALMAQKLGYDPTPYLPSLWFDVKSIGPQIRYAYMDVITRLYQQNFTQQLGDWCRERGVQYIGHIVEDMNSHARLWCSAGHYFRSLDGQDMSGIDIVLHQVMPGFANYISTASCAGGRVDPAFFHYVLGQLGASSAHINPLQQGRAMCEVFGAYGWAEGLPMMKWLMDFLLVRGINRFVPHAFSPDFPDPDCPPHFGAGGQDPQFQGFGVLMRYVNKVSHLLTGGEHRADVALVYHGEGEWMSGDDRMLMQEPAKELYDHHLCYDIVCCDDLCAWGRAEKGKLLVRDEQYSCLVVPYAKYLPDQLLRKLRQLSEQGAAVLYAGDLPKGLEDQRALPVSRLADFIHQQFSSWISVKGDCPLLRHFYTVREGQHCLFFFNEAVDRCAKAKIQLPVKGDYLSLDLLGGNSELGRSEDGCIDLDLAPYCSRLYIFDENDNVLQQLAKEKGIPKAGRIKVQLGMDPLRFSLSLADCSDLETYTPYCDSVSLFNVTSFDHRPDFSGYMKYETVLSLPPAKGERLVLDLGQVGQTARLTVNGKDCGTRICPPYAFDLTDAAVCGENCLEILVANTLANVLEDSLSSYIQIPPSGLLGPVTLWRVEASETGL